MTREDFLKLQDKIVHYYTTGASEPADEAERERIRAVTYEQAVQNDEDNEPLFGWNPRTPQKTRDERAAEWRRRLHPIDGKLHPLSYEDELWSAISTAIAVYKARIGIADDAKEDAVVDEVVLDLLGKYINDYPEIEPLDQTN